MDSYAAGETSPALIEETIGSTSPEEFARYLAEEIARWGRLIREKGIKGD